MPNINAIGTPEALLLTLRDFTTGRGTFPTPGYTGTGNGIMHNVSAFPAAISETWTLTCTTLGGHGVAIFSVTGSTSGAQASLTVGTFYENTFIELTIDDGSTDFAVSDEFTIVVTEGVMKSLNPWVLQRWWPVILDDVTGSDFNSPGLAYDGNFLAAGVMTVFASTGGKWQIEYQTAVEWDTYTIWPHQSTGWEETETPRDWTVEYSDDGVNWAVADTQTTQTGWNEAQRTYAFGSAVGRHIFWRIDFTDNNGAVDIVVAEIQPIMVGDGVSHIRTPQLILKGVGLAGGDNIFIGWAVATNVTRSYYNLACVGSSSFNPDLAFGAQPSKSPTVYWVLSNIASIEHWIVVTARKVIIITKIGTVYTSCYMGLILPYAVPSEYTYPLFVAANDRTFSTQISETDTDFSSFWKASDQAAYLKHPGGDWAKYVTKANNVSLEFDKCTWPWSIAGLTGWSDFIVNFRDNIDGSYSILPAILHQQYDDDDNWHPNMFGEIDGVFWVSGINQVSENTFTLDSDDYIVFQNCFRTGRSDFFALRMD